VITIPHIALATIKRLKLDKFFVFSGSPQLSSSNGRCSGESSNNEGPRGHRYKFKTNIKQRYNADFDQTDNRSSRNIADPKSQESSNSSGSNAQIFKMDQNNSASQQLRCHPMSSSSRGDMKLVPESTRGENQQEPNSNQVWSMVTKPSTLLPPCQGVPAFALHENGPFYIPLTLDKSVVTPFLSAIDPTADPPLHPVTISVCFLLSTPSGEKQLIKSSIPGITPISIPIPLTVAPPLLKPVYPKRVQVGTSKFPFINNCSHPPPQLIPNVHHNEMYRPYGYIRHGGPDTKSRSSFSNSSSSCTSLNSGSSTHLGMIQRPGNLTTNPEQGRLKALPPCYSDSSSVSGSDSGKGGSGSATNYNGHSTNALKERSSFLARKDNMSSSGGSSVSVPGHRPSLAAIMSHTSGKRSSSRSPCLGSQGSHSWNAHPQSHSSTGAEPNDYRYNLAQPTNRGFFGAFEGSQPIVDPVWNKAQFVGHMTSVSRANKTRRMTARGRNHYGTNAGRGRRGANNVRSRDREREIQRAEL